MSTQPSSGRNAPSLGVASKLRFIGCSLTRRTASATCRHLRSLGAFTITERPTTAEDITRLAVASFDGCRDERLRELMQALTRHLHAFVSDVGLRQEEWRAAIVALTKTGAITDDRRQEFILWSDALGVSMLVDALAVERPAGATESTVVGPFWASGAPLRRYGESIGERQTGMPLRVRGRILGTDGVPIVGAAIEVWQNDTNELYSVQDPDAPEGHLRGRFVSEADGSYAFVGVRPVPYRIPFDGPVGEMLEATGRHPWRPAHIHIAVSAPGYESLATHVFDGESPYLDSDAVFAVKPSLIRTFEAHEDGTWYSLDDLDIVLAEERGRRRAWEGSTDAPA
jgi:catechol 1,2-dioxygenase